MSGDPELWNYRTGAEARQPLRKQSWNIPSALAAASALTLAASALSSRRQTWRQNDSIKLDLTEKTASPSQERTFESSTRVLALELQLKGVLPPFESVLEDHSRTVMSPPGSLLLRPRGGKKRSWSGRFRTEQSSRLFFWWRRNPSAGLSAGAAHYFIPDRFAVFPLTFSNARSVPSPSFKVFRQTSSVVYDGSRPKHKEGLSAGL